jgi:predicted nuclease of predicted toxin-antitoxin system
VNLILQKWHTTDSEISKYADENEMVVITKDSDFKDSHFINSTPKKLIKINLGNTTNSDLIILFDRYLYFILPLNNKGKFYIEVSKEQLTIID